MKDIILDKLYRLDCNTCMSFDELWKSFGEPDNTCLSKKLVKNVFELLDENRIERKRINPEHTTWGYKRKIWSV